MKITDTRGPRPFYTCCSDIPVGTVFYGKVNVNTHSPLVRILMLKTYSGVVSLEDPSVTWEPGPVLLCEYEPVNAELIIR